MTAGKWIFIAFSIVLLIGYIAYCVWADLRNKRDRREWMARLERQNAVSNTHLRAELVGEMRKALRAEGIEPKS